MILKVSKKILLDFTWTKNEFHFLGKSLLYSEKRSLCFGSCLISFQKCEAGIGDLQFNLRGVQFDVKIG